MEIKKKQSVQVTNNLLRTKLLGWNTSYIYSVPGLLNIIEMVLCQVSIYLMNVSCRPAYSAASSGFIGDTHDIYFYLSIHFAEIATGIIFFTFVISESSRMLVEKTVLVVAFWLAAFFAMAVVSTYLFLINSKIYASNTQPTTMHKLVSSILGMTCAFLYSINSVLAYKTCRNSWLYMCTFTSGYLFAKLHVWSKFITNNKKVSYFSVYNALFIINIFQSAGIFCLLSYLYHLLAFFGSHQSALTVTIIFIN